MLEQAFSQLPVGFLAKSSSCAISYKMSQGESVMTSHTFSSSFIQAISEKNIIYLTPSASGSFLYHSSID